jgi:hypothetical protein
MKELEDNEQTRIGWKLYHGWFHVLAIISIIGLIITTIYGLAWYVLIVFLVLGSHACFKLYTHKIMLDEANRDGLSIIEYINKQNRKTKS